MVTSKSDPSFLIQVAPPWNRRDLLACMMISLSIGLMFTIIYIYIYIYIYMQPAREERCPAGWSIMCLLISWRIIAGPGDLPQAQDLLHMHETGTIMFIILHVQTETLTEANSRWMNCTESGDDLAPPGGPGHSPAKWSVLRLWIALQRMGPRHPQA